MIATFDPYHKWLGIPPEEQPPHYYRLLGVRALESDPDVIEAAADQRMGHLRNYQSGLYSVWSQRLLNEVAAAKICLLNASKKAAYDAALLGRPAVSPPPPPEHDNSGDLYADALALVSPAPQRKPSYARAGRKAVRQGVIAYVAGSVALCCLLAVLLHARTHAGPTGSKAPAPTLPPKVVKDQPTSSPTALQSDVKKERPAVGTARPEPPPVVKPSRPYVFGPMNPAPEVNSDEEPLPLADQANKAATQDAIEQLFIRDESRPSRQTPAAPGSRKSPVPDESALDAARWDIDKIYEKALESATTPAKKLKLAGEFFLEGNRSWQQPAVAYVLLQRSVDLYVQAKDADQTEWVIATLARRFDIDAPATMAKAIARIIKSNGLRDEQWKAAVEHALQTSEELARAGRYREAVDLASLARDRHRRRKDPEYALGLKIYDQLKRVVAIARGEIRIDETSTAGTANALIGPQIGALETK